MSAEEKEGGRKREREKTDEMEKSSSELFALLQNLPSVCSLVSINRAFDMQVGDGHFQFFQEGKPLRPGIRKEQHGNGYTAKKKEHTGCFLSVFYGKRSRF